MKSLLWRLSGVAVLAGVALLGRGTPARAAEEGGELADRLERLERHVKEMTQHQEKIAHQMGALMERQGPREPAGPETLRPPFPPPEGVHPPMAPGGGPPAAKHAEGIANALGLLFLIGIICNIMMAVWIFTDIRKRGEGPAIFVAMALVAGIPAALIYALTRIGDKKAPTP